jgi:hypothetical protein
MQDFANQTIENSDLDRSLDPTTIQQVPYPEHPDRCQGPAEHGQCPNFAVPGGQNCLVHGGNKQIESQKAASLKNYRAGQWQAKINRFSESSQIKDLREEVGILRMLMEERLTFCKTPHDLLIQSGVISELVMKIEKVVASCHKLEASLGQHMDKTALMGFAQQVIQVISINVSDREIIDTVANGIVELVIGESDDN